MKYQESAIMCIGRSSVIVTLNYYGFALMNVVLFIGRSVLICPIIISNNNFLQHHARDAKKGLLNLATHCHVQYTMHSEVAIYCYYTWHYMLATLWICLLTVRKLVCSPFYISRSSSVIDKLDVWENVNHLNRNGEKVHARGENACPVSNNSPVLEGVWKYI